MELARAIFAVFFALAVLVLWLVLIYFTIQSLRTWRKEKRAPVETLRASVSRCYEEEDFVLQYADRVVAHHMVEFTAEDGRRFTFSMTPGQFRQFDEGDNGILRIRNESFVSFESLTGTGQAIYQSGSDAERVYRRIVRGK
ncbi:MAG: DUF2500 family protein [Armatimonadota bacterium]